MTHASLSAFETRVEREKETPIYASVSTVLKALKDWQVNVLGCEKLMFEDKYKTTLHGCLSDLPQQVQEFIISAFEVKFEGTEKLSETVIHFQVRRAVA